MVEPTTERGRRVAALSQRLRVLHSELTTETLELRYEQLRDEVQRVVSTLQPHERERFLQELMAEFPVWSAGGAPLPSAPSTSATMMMKIEPEVTDPKTLMEKLVAACKGLPEHERAKIEAGLRAVELSPNDQLAWSSLSLFYVRNGQIKEAESAGAKARILSWGGKFKQD